MISPEPRKILYELKTSAVFCLARVISSVINRKNPSNIIIIHQTADLTKICLLVDEIK